MSAADTAEQELAARRADAAGADTGAEPGDGAERPRRDAPPRKRAKPRRSTAAAGGASSAAKPRGAVLKAQSRQLEAKLAELLMFPAVPVAMVSQEPDTQAYMIEHFSRSGPRTAAALVEASETNEQLRALLERITTGGSMFAVVLAVAGYVAPPVLWTIGMRQQAAMITQATTVTPDELGAMMTAAHAQASQDAQAAAAAANGGAEPGSPPAGAGAGEGIGQPPA